MKLKTIFSPRKIFIVITMLILALSLGVLQKPAESTNRAVITMLAIEEKEGEITAVAKILTPGTPGAKSEKIYAGKGGTLSRAMDEISLQTGKRLGFAHCEAILIGDNLATENLLDNLDYLTRTKKVSRSVLLVNFSGNIVEIMKAILYINDNLSLRLEQIIDFDDLRILNTDATVEEFYQKYYGEVAVAVIPKIELTDEEESGLEIQTNSQGSASSGNSIGGQASGGSSSISNTQSKYLKNDGTTSIFYEGKKLREMTRAETEIINWFAKKSQDNLLVMHNVTGHEFNDATIYFNALKIKDKYSYKFKNGVPNLKIEVDILGEIQQIIQEGEKKDFLRPNTDLFNDTLKSAIKNEVEKLMREGFETMQNEQLDFLNIYEDLNKYHHKKFKKYLQGLDDKNDYLKNIILEIEVKSKLAL